MALIMAATCYSPVTVAKTEDLAELLKELDQNKQALNTGLGASYGNNTIFYE